MNEELKDMLLAYLGELMHQKDNTHDWAEKDKVINKINACNLLLGFEAKDKTWIQQLAEELKSSKWAEKQ